MRSRVNGTALRSIRSPSLLGQFSQCREFSCLACVEILTEMLYPMLFLATLALCGADVSHLEHEPSTEPPPRPYAFAYTAGRFPGHTDRHHAEVSDGSGVVRGTFSYVDPRNKVRKVDYVADKEGFHPILSDAPPELPADSESVARAKNRHYQLYAKIAEEHASYPHPAVAESALPRQSAAVVAATAKHAELFRVIAEQHARIAAEREELQKEDESVPLQELGHE